MQQQWTISWSDCNMWWQVDFIWQPAMTSSQGTEKKLQSTSQTQTCTQKRSWSLFGGLLALWSTDMSESITSESMLSKSVRCTENCNACSQHWLTEWAQFFSMTVPDDTCTTFTSKVEWIGLSSFASFAVFTWPLANWLLLLQASWQLFAGKMLPQPAGGRKCFPGVESWSTGFHAIWINRNLFLIDKNVLIVRVPILINKDMFEPSYNDLKFTVWNCNYFCTNLIEFASEAMWSWSFVCWNIF